MACFMSSTLPRCEQPQPRRVLASTKDALVADRDERDIREDLQVAFAIGLGQHGAVLQRLAHQSRLNVSAAIAADELRHAWLSKIAPKMAKGARTAAPFSVR